MDTAKAERVMKLLIAQLPEKRPDWVELGQRIARALVKDAHADPDMLAVRILERAD